MSVCVCMYVYMYTIYICGHLLPEPPSSIQYIGQCYHFAKVSLFQCNIFIYVDAQLILNMYISFHSYIYIHTHMSFTSYVLMIVAFTPPFLALKHAFSSMGSSLRSGWIQCHETIEHRNGEMRLHLRER
jgi:hypothetical protein